MSGPIIARALLVADSPVSAITPGSSIYLGEIPQSPPLPCIGVSEVSSTDRATVKGSRGATTKVTSLVQVTVCASAYPACKTLMGKVRAALRDFLGDIGGFSAATCRIEGAGPDFTTDQGFCAKTLDVRITFDEA